MAIAHRRSYLVLIETMHISDLEHSMFLSGIYSTKKHRMNFI